MAVFKCKMCGAVLDEQNNETIVSCAYCGTQQMLPGVDIPSGFSDEAELIRIKNHRDDIDKSNQKVKKYFWVAFSLLVVLPAIPFLFGTVIDLGVGTGLAEKIVERVILFFVGSFLQLSFSLPALITTIVYMFVKPKSKKTRKLVSVFNVFSKIFLFSEIGFYSMIGILGLGPDMDDMVFGSMFLLISICNIAILVISFLKKDYKY